MGAYEYSALNSAGRLQRGVLQGDTARQVRQHLREQGLSPVSVDEISEQKSRKTRVWGRKKISGPDLALITRQLATLVRSGTVLEEALKAVAEQSEKGGSKSVLAAVRAKVLEGHTLASALADFPGIFSPLYLATVEAGEQAGQLDLVFERLADYTGFRHHLQQKIMLTLLYPLLLSVVATLIVIGLLTYVVPQVVTVFDQVGQQLPLLTRSLIAVSEFLQSWGLLLLVLVVILTIGGRWLFRYESVKIKVHGWLLHLPVLGRVLRVVNAARFSRSLSILAASGVSVVDGLVLSARVLNNLVLRQAVEQAAGRVREGESLHRALAVSGYFPPITLHLIASGEASACLDEMLEKGAVAQEKEVETLLAAAMGIFEPVLILVMGGVVLAIVLAILLPIMDLNQLVR